MALVLNTPQFRTSFQRFARVSRRGLGEGGINRETFPPGEGKGDPFPVHLLPRFLLLLLPLLLVLRQQQPPPGYNAAFPLLVLQRNGRFPFALTYLAAHRISRHSARRRLSKEGSRRQGLKCEIKPRPNSSSGNFDRLYRCIAFVAAKGATDG